MDNKGNFALKMAVTQNNLSKIDYLMEHSTNINRRDYVNRTVFHHVLNNWSSRGADTNFKIERKLLSYGGDINIIDNRGRTPLHYVFVRIGEHKIHSKIDPIETVSSYCAIKDALIDEPDLWKKTPLHYASQRGASISCLYLIENGAKLEAKDENGNTPLSIAFINNHSGIF